MITHKKTAVFFILLLLLLLLTKQYIAIHFLWFILIGIIWLSIVAINSAQIKSNYHVKAYCSNPSLTENKIALTFDDGPSAITLEILDVLKKYDVKATFFCIGKNIEKYPEIIKRVLSEGHQVGNHSYSHSPFFDFYNAKKILEEINRTNVLLEKFTSKKIQFFRPPYGVTTPSIRRALQLSGHKVIGWSVRSLDGGIKDQKIIYNRIIKRVSPGGIVLLHDTGKHSVLVLEQFLQFLQQNNYTVISVEKLLNLKAYEV